MAPVLLSQDRPDVPPPLPSDFLSYPVIRSSSRLSSSDRTSTRAGKDHISCNQTARPRPMRRARARLLLLSKGTAPRSQSNQYAELKRLIKQNGLLDRQPAYYAGKIILTHGLLAVSLTLLLILDNPWLQLLNAAYLAFVFVQIGLLAHDCGHRQFSFRASWKNEYLTLILGNLLLGISRQWWIDKHNEHHAHPNQIDVDPDIEIPLLAFKEEQALDKRGLAGFLVKHQAILIIPLSLLQALSLHRNSIRFLLEKKAKSTLAEALALGAHFALYFGLLFSVLE